MTTTNEKYFEWVVTNIKYYSDETVDRLMDICLLYSRKYWLKFLDQKLKRIEILE